MQSYFRNVFQKAPFGVSDEPTNYGTFLRPNTANDDNNFSKKGDDLILKFREKLAARGTRGIMGIRRNFKICDDDNYGNISYPEFAKLIKDYRIAVYETEVKKLYSIFDSDKSGHIDYNEFLRGVVGEMNDNRKIFVLKAFKKLDSNKFGHRRFERRL